MSDMNSKVKIDFNNLSPNIHSLQKQDISIFLELMKGSYKTLLKHPLSEAFLHLKWKQIKYLHLIMIIVNHFIYSTVYTIYSLLVFGTICKPETNQTMVGGNLFNWSDADGIRNISRNWSISIPCHNTQDYYSHIVTARIAWVSLIIFTVIYVTNESVKIITTPKLYFKKWDSYIDLLLIISFLLISFHSNPFTENPITMSLWQWHMAAIGCFFTWLQMMFLIGKLPRFGKYVQMFRCLKKLNVRLFKARVILRI